ncbi:hypothetical protein ACIBKY_04880 [Nonomuraea sp. NPDC050394]|uniref:hypothetical protein n=1 Tax=Nonomuraea sp. NPDC050394 TaxID=3364363 RepID=UPI0037A5EF77
MSAETAQQRAAREALRSLATPERFGPAFIAEILHVARNAEWKENVVRLPATIQITFHGEGQVADLAGDIGCLPFEVLACFEDEATQTSRCVQAWVC